MKKMYKAMALLLCAVLLVAGSVMGTMAFLQSQTKTISNVMTVGKVEITLKEFAVDVDGKKTGTVIEANDQDISGIKLIPNRVIQKHPFITIDSESEKCYLFVKIENTIPSEYGNTNLDNQKWVKLPGSSNVYYYSTVVDGTSGDIDVFTTFTCAADVTKYTTTNGLNIKITAYAVQAEGFGSAEEAWNATFGANN